MAQTGEPRASTSTVGVRGKKTRTPRPKTSLGIAFQSIDCSSVPQTGPHWVTVRDGRLIYTTPFDELQRVIPPNPLLTPHQQYNTVGPFEHSRDGTFLRPEPVCRAVTVTSAAATETAAPSSAEHSQAMDAEQRAQAIRDYLSSDS